MKGGLYWDGMTKTYWRMVSNGFSSMQPRGHPNSKFKLLGRPDAGVSGWFEEVPGLEYPRFFITTATGV